jgi:hypothetical protein
MAYICTKCPNKTDFRKLIYGRAHYTYTRFVDEDDGITDDESPDYDEHEDLDVSTISCDMCESEDVEDVDEDEWNSWSGPVPEKKTWRSQLGK